MTATSTPADLGVAGVVSRTSGHVATQQIERPDRATLIPFVESVTEMGATVYTDEHGGYVGLPSLWSHETVNHSAGESEARHTRTAWRAIGRYSSGVFEKHLDRYLAEYRWNMLPLSSAQRVDAILKAGVGGRLTYEELISEPERGYSRA